MTKQRAEQSNPISTGGGGVIFEVSVQTYFAMHIITGDELPFLKKDKAIKMKLQGHYAGYNTDDCIVFGNDGRRLLCQIKNSVTISANDTTFRAVITDAWNDYCNIETFDSDKDQIVLVVPGLSKTDIANTTEIFDWARHCESEAEFIRKVTEKKFSSNEKRSKYHAIREQLTIAKGETISDFEVWDFFKHFYIQVLELDRVDTPLYIAVSNQFSRVVGKRETANELYRWIADYDKNAGTVTRDMLLHDLSIDGKVVNSDIVKKIKNHNDTVIASMRDSINGFHVDRSEYVIQVDNALLKNDIVFILGGRGVGKTGIIKSFLDLHCNSAFNVLFRAEELNKPSINGVFSELNWKFELEELNQVSLGYQRRYIFIESLERILENEYKKAFIDLMTFVFRNTGWRIITTIRDYASQQIMMDFLAVSQLHAEYIKVEKLEEIQLEEYFEKQSSSIFDCINKDTFELLRIPIYLDYIVRAINGGYVLSKNDTYQSIKEAIWENVIKKASERRNGFPAKRENIFINVAIQRAKQLRYEIPEDSFDAEIILKLEEDGLVSIHNGNISITHDVLEDWALERWIEKCFKGCLGDYRKFFEKIGFEQSICRAYRLWLEDKFFEDEFLMGFSEFILSVSNEELYSVWADETIAAVIYSDKLKEILKEFKKQILSQTQILNKICFMIRVAAKRLDKSLKKLEKSMRITEQSAFIQLKPEGNCWKEYICFLYENKEALPSEFYPHCNSLLSEWVEVISLKNDILPGAREAGLLAIYIIKKMLMDKFPDKEATKRLLKVSMCCYGSIRKEFNDFIESIVFDEECREKYGNIENLMMYLLTDFSCGYIAKYDSQLLVRIAKREWLISEQSKKRKFPYSPYGSEEKIYGFNYDGEYGYNQPSGLREPFHALFNWNTNVAIDFVLELCNNAVQTYINQKLVDKNEKEKRNSLENITCKIKKDDGTIIEQIVNREFWCAYRGSSIIPGVIQCALMALENFLLVYWEQFKENKKNLDALAEYLISNSNSVLITAVVASVFTAKKKYISRTELLLLQNKEFYSLDLSRSARESTSDFFMPQAQGKDKLFYDERKKSKAYEWRKETLETLCVRLQFSELREEIWGIIDSIDITSTDDSLWQFCRRRIDLREFVVEENEKKNGFILTSKPVEGNLKLMQEKQEEKNDWLIRYSKLLQWSDDYNRNNSKRQLEKSITDCIEELKILLEHYYKPKSGVLDIYMKGINQTIAIFFRDYYDDLTENESMWIIQYIKKTLEIYDQSHNYRDFSYSDIQGVRALASVVPKLLEKIPFNEFWNLLIKMLTSFDYQIRLETARGISKYIWDIDTKLAKRCIAVIYHFDILEQKDLALHMPFRFVEARNEQAKRAWIEKSRKELFDIEEITQGSLSLSGTTLLLAILPTKHIYFDMVKEMFASCIDKICFVEQKMIKCDEDRDDDSTLFYTVEQYNTESIGTIFYNLTEQQLDTIKNIVEKMGLYAPYTCKWVICRYKLLCENNHRYSDYWHFWTLFTKIAKEISVKLNKGEDYRFRRECELLKEYMYVDYLWQPVDYQNQPVREGVEYICSFAKETIQNPIVYEGLASLMYHFPDSYLEKGIAAQSDVSEVELAYNYQKSLNSAFYMENNIYAYVTQLETNAIPAKMYKSCNKILNVLIKRSSSKAYYVREYLLKSKKMR